VMMRCVATSHGMSHYKFWGILREVVSAPSILAVMAISVARLAFHLIPLPSDSVHLYLNSFLGLFYLSELFTEF